jgi:dienelactone hydrolase
MTYLRLLGIGVAAILAPLTARAQPSEKAKPGDVMIEKYLAAETDKLSKKFMDGAKTLEEWQQKRPRLYQEYMDMLGLWPLPEKTPLKATITGTIEAPDFFIDKLHYQSKPGLYVTANLYRPANTRARSVSEGSKKYPAVLYVCGHSNRGRDGNKTAFQDHGIWFARNGYICLMVDTLQLGEIPGVHHGTYGRPWNHLAAYGIKGKDKVENRWWWHCLGYTPAGVECWNGVRGIDYLVSRPDVDPERLAVTGISGGGAATFWIAAADDRVKCAVPVSGMSDLESYVKNKVINGHCDCMFLYNTYQWDWTTIAALVAPRPLLFANSDNDPIFPMDANRRIIAKLRTTYKMYGKPELVDDYVSKGGHDYRPDLRIAVFKWINRHVKGETTTVVKDVDGAVFAGKMLRVFSVDAEIPKNVRNAFIDESFMLKQGLNLRSQDKFKDWKARALAEIRKLCFRGMREKPAVVLRKPSISNPSFTLEAEEGIAFELGPSHRDPVFKKLTVVIPNSTEAQRDTVQQTDKLFRQLLGGDNHLWITARGIEEDSEWTKKSPPNYVERSHALLGRTVDDGRVVDIVSVFRWMQASGQTPEVRLVGRGQAGILAAYAALFEPSIKEVVIIDPPKSHKESPYFLNVLRVLDIPEALGLLAPEVKLTLINARDPAFDRTAEIYRLAGAGEKLVRK